MSGFVKIGHNIESATVTTLADAPAGSLIVIFVGDYDDNGSDFSSYVFSDSAGNTYTFGAQSTPTAGVRTTAFFYCSNSAHDLPSGATVSVSGSDSGEQIVVTTIGGYNGGLDVHASVVESSSVTSIDLAVPTLSTSTEAIIGYAVGTANANGYTESNGYASIAGASVRDESGYFIESSSTSAPHFAPSWVTSQAASAIVAAFKATGAPPANKPLPPFSFAVH